MKNKLIIILSSFLFILMFSNCKKFVEVDGPTTSVSVKNVYNNDATAIGAITSLYVNLTSSSMTDGAEMNGLSCISGLSADELVYYKGAGNALLSTYYQNTLTSMNPSSDNFWTIAYNRIYRVNSAIEGLSTSNGLTLAVKQQLLGEAKFMRAFYFFYLVNLYGDIPLALSSDYTVNAIITRTSKEQVYRQIKLDLIDAQGLLSNAYLKQDCITPYLNGSEERIRPTKWAAIALLARVYLYVEDWKNAEIQSTMILSQQDQYNLESISHAFLKNNKEAIWQLQPIGNGGNTIDAATFILPAEGPSVNYPVYLNENLMKDFEPADRRKNNWTSQVIANGVTYYYPFKYKAQYSFVTGASIAEYSTVLRLAEQYLIRAECRARLDNLDNAISDVDQIRKRAGLNLIKDINPDIVKEDLIALILKERRIELFTEWGHRWLDLKRTGKIDEVMSVITPQKGNASGWKTYQQLFPISISELKANPRLTQNKGY